VGGESGEGVCGDGGSGWDYDEGFGVGVWEEGEGGLGCYEGVFGGGGEEVEEEHGGESEVVVSRNVYVACSMGTAI